jgi:hypothetical protein
MSRRGAEREGLLDAERAQRELLVRREQRDRDGAARQPAQAPQALDRRYAAARDHH